MSRVLVKHCKAKDNIFERGSVKLGTLEEYRSTEDQLRKDAGEGTFDYRLQFPEPIEVDSSWLDSIVVMAAPMDAPYDLNCETSISYEPIGQSKKLMVQGSVDISIKFKNCFVFCMSIYDSVDQIEQPFPDAPDYWYFEEQYLNMFNKMIFRLLSRSAKYSMIFEPYYWPTRMIPEDAEIEFRRGRKEVEYEREMVVVSQQSDFDPYTLSDKFWNSPFIKPSRYRSEKEFRLAYLMYANGQAVGVKDEAAILELPSVPLYLSRKA